MERENDKAEQAIMTLAEQELPVPMEELEADANLGGKITFRDIGFPYLYVLQSMSPQVNPDNSKYIEGAMPGMLFLTNLDRVYDGRNEGLDVVLCHYDRKMTMWRQREQGGGFHGAYDPNDPVVKEAKPNERGILTLPNGMVLVDTAYHFLMAYLPDSQSWTQAVMPLKSTGMKASRKVSAIIQASTSPSGKPLPRFTWKWRLTTYKEQKDNYIWSSPRFERIGMVPKGLYERGKEFATLAAREDIVRRVVEAEAGDNEPANGNGQISDKDVPF